MLTYFIQAFVSMIVYTREYIKPYWHLNRKIPQLDSFKTIYILLNAIQNIDLTLFCVWHMH